MVWGGFRVGAGRKPSGKRKVNFYITESEEQFLRDCLSKHRLTVKQDDVQEGEFLPNLLSRVNDEIDRTLVMPSESEKKERKR